MIIIASLEAIALVAIVHLLLRHYAQTERAWAEERAELLNRIQRPDQLPVRSAEPFVTPEVEDDEIALVGVIQDPPEEN